MLLKRVAAICLLFSGITFLASINAQAQVLVSAKILSSSGSVEIQRRAQGYPPMVRMTYRINDELIAGDVIKTNRGGRLVLGLTDGSQAIISENTTVEITDLSGSPRTIFNLWRGKTRIKIEKVGGRPNPYRVNTTTAVIAVRGTLFDVFATEKETQVFVHEGEVEVSSLTSGQPTVILTPGERTRVEPSRPPEPPSHFRPGRNDDNFRPRPNNNNNGPNDQSAGGRDRDRDGSGRQPSQPGNQPGNGQGNSPGQGSPPPPQPPPPPGPGGSGGGRPHEEFLQDAADLSLDSYLVSCLFWQG